MLRFFAASRLARNRDLNFEMASMELKDQDGLPAAAVRCVPRKGVPGRFQECSRKEPLLEVAAVRRWVPTPGMHRPMTGGGGPIADGTGMLDRGSAVCVADPFIL